MEGRLTPDELRAVLGHVDACTTCRAGGGESDLPSDLWREPDRNSRAPWASRAPAADPAQAPDPPRLAGVEPLQRLGGGGCADVWLARDEAGFIAVKVVHAALCGVELRALRLYKAAAEDPVLGLFPILHIARCERTARLCYTMPLADALRSRTLEAAQYEPDTLHARVALTRGLEERELLDVARDILPSLHALHAAGLVHRDVKPTNILRYHGRWRLADTGLLVREGRATDSGRAGTPTFAPPDGRTDERTADLFALGRTLRFALAARRPATRTSAVPFRLAVARRTSERRIRRCLERACAPARGERFGSAREMLRSLEAAAVPPARARRVVAWASAALLVLGCALRPAGSAFGLRWLDGLGEAWPAGIPRIEAALSADEAAALVAKEPGRLGVLVLALPVERLFASRERGIPSVGLAHVDLARVDGVPMGADDRVPSASPASAPLVLLCCR